MQRLIEKEISERLTRFINAGGPFEFMVYRLEEGQEGYAAHLLAAQESLRLLQADDRETPMTILEDVLAASGTKISAREFFGPLFDLPSRRVILRGLADPHRMNYFYHDGQETKEQIVKRLDWKAFQSEAPNGIAVGFTEAFFYPPYGIRIGATLLEQGTYFLEFCDYFFSDLDRIVVYTWSTDCSNYFDWGKEWWGSFFWTVYNPVKGWYVGILASRSD